MNLEECNGVMRRAITALIIVLAATAASAERDSLDIFLKLHTVANADGATDNDRKVFRDWLQRELKRMTLKSAYRKRYEMELRETSLDKTAADPRNRHPDPRVGQTITYWSDGVYVTTVIRAPVFKAPRHPKTPFERYWFAREVSDQSPVDRFSAWHNWKMKTYRKWK